MELNIAVVDDFATDCEQIEKHINRYLIEHKSVSADVMRFCSAEEFLKVYRKGFFHIIFLDICMGGMNGIELSPSSI